MLALTRRAAALVLVTGGCAVGGTADPAYAFNPVKPVCKVAGYVSGVAGKACSAVQNGGRLLNAGKKLLDGHLGGAVRTAVGAGGGVSGSTATTAIGLAAIGAWVLGGAKFALHETGKVLSQTTSPQLRTTWFSATYWHMAGIAAVLTLPFLFAAAVQALVRSDLALLARATLGYLPLATIAVGVAAPLTMLLLAASDQMSAVISSAAGHASAQFLNRASLTIGALTVISGSPFLAFLVGLFTVAGALTLWMELLMREAAVYVIVLMLPLAFAALVWPARRVWAIRTVELLVALVLSKFAIVAVLSLGGAAMSGSVGHSITGWIAGLVLLTLGAFAPWALLRLLPLAELASGAAGSLRADARGAVASLETADGLARKGEDWATSTIAQMRRDVETASEPVPTTGEGSNAAEQAEHLSDLPLNEERSVDVRAGGEDGAAEEHSLGADRDGASADGSTPSVSDLGPDGFPPGGERLPGSGSMWQADDRSWRPLTLGLEDGWPPPRLWPADEHGDIAVASGEAARNPEDRDAEPSTAATATADDRDAMPAPQEPADGRL